MSVSSGTRVAILGGAGFIGSWLAESLARDAGHLYNVTVIDNLITGSLANIWDKSVDFIEADITKEIPDIPFDVIYHLASPASPIDYLAHPFETLHANVDGTMNAIALAKRHRAHLVYVSTSEVYGDPLVSPQTEDYNGNVSTIGDRAVYDESKRMGETLVYAYWKHHGLSATIVRIFNTYGPRMRKNDGRVIPAFINAALAGDPLTIYGDGSHTRSFLYVSDTVQGLMSILWAMNSPKKPNRTDLLGPFNLGGSKEITIQILADLVIQRVHRTTTRLKSEIIYADPMFSDDPKQRRADTTRLANFTNWSQKVDLTVGLDATIDYFREET